MTTRRILLLDRLAALVLAAALIVLGLVAGWWWTDPSQLADRTDTGSIARVVDMHWFPWASVLGGVILVYLGIRWLAAHLSRSNVSDLRLAGSGDEGTLVVEAGPLAAAAAQAFVDTIGVRSAKGAITRDRGQLVARITATIDPQADLASIAQHADLVAAQLGDVLGRRDLRCRVELSVARTARKQPRVS